MARSAALALSAAGLGSAVLCLVAPPRLGRAPLRRAALRAAAAGGPEEEPQRSEEPALTSDWRAFRAALIAQERSEGSEGSADADADGSTAEGASAAGAPWMHVTPLIEKGSVLLAKPGPWSIHAPCFHKGVILVTEHHEEYGSMGFLLNRPTPEVAFFGGVEFNVWYGGPCQGLEDPHADRWWYCLHRRADLAEEGPIVKGVFLTKPSTAAMHVMSGRAKREEFMLLAGHCGWAPQQLQDELDEGDAWLMVASDTDALLSSLPRQQAALHRSRGRSGQAAFGRGFPLWSRLFGRASASADVPWASSMLDRRADDVLADWSRSLFWSRAADKGSPETTQEEDQSAEGLEHVQGEAVVAKILNFMSLDLVNPTIQENGCEALRHMVTDDESRAVVTARSGIDAVLKAMRTHPDHAGVQGHCSGTLAHLSVGAEQREVISETGGLDVVLAGMRAHRNSDLVQYKACGMLANFASDAQEQLEVATHGGIEDVLEAMKHHSGNERVQDHCIGTLYNLARGGDQSKQMITAAGGISVVQQAVDTYPAAPTVQKVGPVLLLSLRQESG